LPDLIGERVRNKKWIAPIFHAIGESFGQLQQFIR